MRCYDGQPDKELSEYIAVRLEARKDLAARFNAQCVWFPMEDKYLVFQNNKPIGDMHEDILTAVSRAISLLVQ